MQVLRRRFLYLSRIALTIGFAIAFVGTTQTGEIKLMSSGGMKVALIEVIPAFELATKHKVTATYGAPGIIKDRIVAGEPLDVLVFPAPGLDDLAKQGKLVADSKIIWHALEWASLGAGAPKRDISAPMH